MTTHFLSSEDALVIHGEAYEGTGGGRDKGMIESALAAPKNLAEYGAADPATTNGIALLCAAYWFHISMNHPFIDGNKRASFMCCVAFLNHNGWDLEIDYDAGLALSLDLASHRLNREALAEAIESKVVPLANA